MNISICIPARDEVATGFAHDLAMLSARWYGNAPPNTRFDVHIVNGTLIADQRAKLARMALTAGADYALFLDSDMRFPSYLLEKLVAHGKDIVACNYAHAPSAGEDGGLQRFCDAAMHLLARPHGPRGGGRDRHGGDAGED